MTNSRLKKLAMETPFTLKQIKELHDVLGKGIEYTEAIAVLIARTGHSMDQAMEMVEAMKRS